jgi:tetratricopeptide (TPR) repeat protein
MTLKNCLGLVICAVGALSNVFGESTSAPARSESVKKDTTIAIDSHSALVFDTYDARFSLWYNPHIIIDGKKRRIAELSYENGSAPALEISPDKKFLLLDNIAMEYVYVNETDSVLHDNAFCVVIDVAAARVVYQGQSDCGAIWNKRGELVNGEQVVFSPPTVSHQNALNAESGRKQKITACTEYLKSDTFKVSKNNLVFLNDCGYYLQAAGDNESAVSVLNKVLKAFPDRAVAHLNIADAYYELGDVEPSRLHYRKYCEIMQKEGKDKKIPARAIERMK